MSWVVMLALAGILAIWLEGDSSAFGRRRFLMASFAFLPMIVGLALAPDLIRKSFGDLASQGISDPSLVGAAMAETCGPLVLGALASVPMLLAYLVLARR